MRHCTFCQNDIGDKEQVCLTCGTPTGYIPPPEVTQGMIIASFVLALFIPILGLAMCVYLLCKDRVSEGIGVGIASVGSWVFWASIFMRNQPAY